MFAALLDVLFPRISPGGKEGAIHSIDEITAMPIRPIHQSSGQLRAQGILALDTLDAVSSYEGIPLLQPALHLLKYQRIRGLHGVLGARMHAGLPPAPTGAVLCPVPLHWSRRFWRGFNQAALLAHVLGRLRGLPVSHLLMRVRPTGVQARRTRQARFAAMHGAFRAKRGDVLPDCVILIDDVATTGATLDACAAALKQAGVARVGAWVLARA
jgi:ComF family protein